MLLLAACSTRNDGDVNEFCRQLRSSSNGAALTINDPSQLRDSSQAFARLANVAPAQIKPSWQALSTSIDELASLDPAVAPDRERMDEIARADQFIDSATKVTEYVKLNCGLDLAAVVTP
jgi:hypothetical protein